LQQRFKRIVDHLEVDLAQFAMARQAMPAAHFCAGR
jgi:hypothetical protein